MKRFLAIFRKRRLDRDLDNELRFHIDSLIEQNLRRGMSPDRARHEAQRSFGGVEQVKEADRSVDLRSGGAPADLDRPGREFRARSPRR